MPLLRRWLYKILGVWGKLGHKEMFLFISNYDRNSRWIANCLKHLLPRCRWLKWYKSLTSDCPDIFNFVFNKSMYHDIVIKWKHFLRYWPFMRRIRRFPVNSPHKGQWRRALMFSLICAWINGWVNNREADDFGRHRPYYDVIVMITPFL